MKMFPILSYTLLATATAALVACGAQDASESLELIEQHSSSSTTNISSSSVQSSFTKPKVAEPLSAEPEPTSANPAKGEPIPSKEEIRKFVEWHDSRVSTIYSQIDLSLSINACDQVVQTWHENQRDQLVYAKERSRNEGYNMEFMIDSDAQQIVDYINRACGTSLNW